MKTRQTLFKGKYLIGIYAPIEEGETLLALCDNAWEFSDLMEISYRTAFKILSNIFNKQTNFIRFFGKNCSIAFIES